jgi:hypothetical protein
MAAKKTLRQIVQMAYDLYAPRGQDVSMVQVIAKKDSAR